MSASQDPSGRRRFLKQLGLAGAGLLGAPAIVRADAKAEKQTPVPQRKFGRHDFTVSSLCLGGHTLRLADDNEAARIVDEALDLGITFFDNSWDYHQGASEKLMGKLIKGRRDKIFLMTKVCTHDTGDRHTAMKMLEESLERLGTDHLDLWQVHAVATQEQVERAFGKDGVMEAVVEAQKQGKVRYIGFTGHTEPDVHLAMLSKGFAFDACQLPISPIEANSNAFVRRVLPELVKQGIAPLAMKTMGGNANPIRDGVLTVDEALSYAFSQPVTTIVTGVQRGTELRENARIASTYTAMNANALASLEERCIGATESNKYQPYRKWMSYRDGDARHYV
jgi:aryl-alcohol dehydrogenase-like predicted oxidoreductase